MGKELRVMRKPKKLILLVVFILLLTSYLLPLTSYASTQDISLGIYPPIIQINSTPPSDIRHEIKIKNSSLFPVTLSITLRPFKAKDDSGHVDFLSENNTVLRDKAIFQKIQVLDADNPVNQIELEPQEEKTLTLKIGLPKDEPPADYYFSVVFLSKEEKADANGPSIAGGIASNVLLSIGPQGPATGFIQKFAAPLYVTNGPIPFTVTVNNLSPYYIAPQGQILISNMYGQLIGNVPLLQENILSQSSRTLTDTKQLQPGKAIWPEKFLFGPYKATLTISLSPEGPLFHRTIYFFAMPLQYLFGFFILIAVVIFLYTRVRRRLHKTHAPVQ